MNSEPSGQSSKSAEDEVKAEPDAARPSKTKQKESSGELHIRSVEELARLKKREMVAEVEYLDGTAPLSGNVLYCLKLSLQKN